MAFKVHDLTKSAVEWAKHEVGLFPGGLRSQLLARDWSAVRLFAWLPADLPTELQEPLDASFVVRLGREHVMDWDYVAAETAYIQSQLITIDRGIFMYQADDFRLDRGLPIRRAPGEKIVTFDRALGVSQDNRQEIWVYQDSGFEHNESVTLTYRRGRWPHHGLGVLTSLPPAYPELDATEVASSATVGELSARTRSILVPAWRGNAFIFVQWPCQIIPSH